MVMSRAREPMLTRQMAPANSGNPELPNMGDRPRQVLSQVDAALVHESLVNLRQDRLNILAAALNQIPQRSPVDFTATQTEDVLFHQVFV